MTIKLVSEEGPMGASMIAPPTGLKGGSVPVAGLAELGLCIGFGIHSAGVPQLGDRELSAEFRQSRDVRNLLSARNALEKGLE